MKNACILKRAVIVSLIIIVALSVIFLYCTSLNHQINNLFLSGNKLISLINLADKNSGPSGWLDEIDRNVFSYNKLKQADLYEPYDIIYGNALMYYKLNNIKDVTKSDINMDNLKDYGYYVPLILKQGKKSIRFSDICMENSKITNYKWKFVSANEQTLDYTSDQLLRMLKKNNINKATNIEIINFPIAFIHVSYFNKEWYIPLFNYREELTGLNYGKAYSEEQFTDKMKIIVNLYKY